MMPMSPLWLSLLLAWGAAGRELQTNPDTCNLDDHHPENDGYYVEGIAGVSRTLIDHDGKRLDNRPFPMLMRVHMLPGEAHALLHDSTRGQLKVQALVANNLSFASLCQLTYSIVQVRRLAELHKC